MLPTTACKNSKILLLLTAFKQPFINKSVHEEMCINTLRPRRNGRYNTDDIFKCIFLKENAWIPTKISLKFVPKGPINNIPALVQIMAWRRPGDKPLSEPMMVSLLTHICVTRPQWVKALLDALPKWCYHNILMSNYTFILLVNILFEAILQ